MNWVTDVGGTRQLNGKKKVIWGKEARRLSTALLLASEGGKHLNGLGKKG